MPQISLLQNWKNTIYIITLFWEWNELIHLQHFNSIWQILITGQLLDDCNSNRNSMISTIRINDSDNTQIMGEQLIAFAGTSREAV